MSSPRNVKAMRPACARLSGTAEPPGSLTRLIQRLKCSLAAGEARIWVRDPPACVTWDQAERAPCCSRNNVSFAGEVIAKRRCAELEGEAGGVDSVEPTSASDDPPWKSLREGKNGLFQPKTRTLLKTHGRSAPHA